MVCTESDEITLKGQYSNVSVVESLFETVRQDRGVIANYKVRALGTRLLNVAKVSEEQCYLSAHQQVGIRAGKPTDVGVVVRFSD
ncbi:MAG: hypothetical protein DDT35_01572 [Firmicutes bacterium]|nr:hypothetical protein [Bacillota bacterium]